jgi:shikimate dehydrogenase
VCADPRCADNSQGVVLGISGTTRVVGIIGRPVSHSLSPLLLNAAFAASGTDMVYVPLPVSSDSLGDAVRGLSALGFAGANVTIPYKTAVLPFLAAVDGDAAVLAAVNTIVVEEGRARGFNTDVEGFRRALREVEPGSLAGRSALLLGAGGAARAVALVLAQDGAEVTVVNRTRAAADALVTRIAGLGGGAHRALALEALRAEHVRSADIVVNGTSLGMAGEGKVPAVLVDNVRQGHSVYDVVYAAQPTAFVALARERGAKAIDGLSMLVWQAAAAFELWTGRAAPLDVMRRAIGR